MTDMMKSFDEQTVKELKDETPLNMLGEPDDIAQTALLLYSDKARFITGQGLGVNGGFVIYIQINKENIKIGFLYSVL